MNVGHGMWADFGGHWPGPLEFIWGLLVLAATIAFWVVLALLLVKLLKSRPPTPFHGSSALKVLEERYARGEITRDEYFERRTVLAGDSSGKHGDVPET